MQNFHTSDVQTFLATTGSPVGRAHDGCAVAYLQCGRPLVAASAAAPHQVGCRCALREAHHHADSGRRGRQRAHEMGVRRKREGQQV